MPPADWRAVSRPRNTEEGSLSRMRNESQMSIDQSNVERSERLERERMAKLGEAHALMDAALRLLDEHSRSPAAATLDLALHHLDGERAG